MYTVMSKETNKNPLEKARGFFDKITIGIIAIGALLGSTAVVAAGALDLGYSKSAGKESNLALARWWKKFKSALGGKSQT